MLRKISVFIITSASFLYAQGQSAEVATTTSTSTSASTPPEEKQESKPTTTISGSADVYYRYDFGKSKGNNRTSFTNAHNSFELGMASVKIEHKMSKVTMVADLGFGNRAREFSYNDEGITAAIKQMYVSYAPAEWVKFTMGSWATHVGYEVVDPYLNRNYSMSYMFTNGPFFHTGLKADITTGKHSFMIGIANPTDFKTSPPEGINKKAFLAQYAFAPTENIKAYLNFVGGEAPDSSKGNQFDLVVTGKVSDKFSIGYNGTVASARLREDGKYSDTKNWWASAVYINVDPQSWLGFTLREEYFSDKDQLKVFSPAAGGGKVFATTLSANFRINNLVIIPEVRVDNGSRRIFTDKDGNNKYGAGSFLIAAVYQF